MMVPRGVVCPTCGMADFRHAASPPMRDPETGAVNRQLLLEAAAPVLSLARRNARTMALLHVHLDGLAARLASSSARRRHKLLRNLTKRMLAVVRDSDFVARLAADRFAVVLSEVWETDAAVRVAHRLVQQLGDGAGRRNGYGVRVGVAFFPHDAPDIHALVAEAERAAPARPTGSGIGFADPMLGADALRRAGLERDLAGDCGTSQFLLHYQPIFAADTAEVVGVEALMRWNHAQQGLLPACDFIPLAERTGRIRALDQWALGQALHDSTAWRASGWDGWTSVNLSGRTISDPRLVDVVARLLDATGADPRSLVFEVTEGTALAAEGEANAVLEGLRSLGARVAIDDFGTGYASFEYLRDFDPDLVKLDRVFLGGDGERHQRLLNSLVSMAHHMGKPVVVEGVEEEEHRERVAASGCDMIQGFLLARPMDASHISRLFLVPSATV